VTGGAGFVGSHLVEALLCAGRDVAVIDDLSTGSRANLPEHPSLRFIEGRVGDRIGDVLTEPVGEVYHLAASVGVSLVMDDPAAAIENNVHETAVRLRALPGAGGPPTLIASSSEVYGKLDKEQFTEDDDALYGPTSGARWSYAAGKALDEHLALAHHRAGRVPVVIARLFNTVGPRQTGRYGMVLPRFVRAALAGEPLEVHGDGEQSRCFCDVRDVTGALIELLATPACRGRVFNVGRDDPITIAELARRVIDLTGSKSELRFVPYGDVYGPGFEDLRRRRPDLSRIAATIGFEPSVPLDRTIRDIAAALPPETRSRGALA